MASAKNVYQNVASSIVQILLKSIAIILTCYTGISSADYVDILNSAIDTQSCAHNVCLGATKSDKYQSYGAGFGYNFNDYQLILLGERHSHNYSAKLTLSYYDRGVSGLIGMKHNFIDSSQGYEIGLGYPINEKFSLIVKYSYGLTHFGVRRWF